MSDVSEALEKIGVSADARRSNRPEREWGPMAVYGMGGVAGAFDVGLILQNPGDTVCVATQRGSFVKPTCN